MSISKALVPFLVAELPWREPERWVDDSSNKRAAFPKRKPSGKDRSKVKAARKQSQKGKRK